MSELATRNTTELDITPANVLGTPGAGTVKLAEWAMELTAAHQLGTALSGTQFVPRDFQGKPDACAAAILAGKSLGLDPMNALSNIFVVHGKPAMYARTMAALVLREGHEVIRSAASDSSVTVRARRKGSREWQEFTWDIQRADKAGYLSNAKYKTNPIEMLTAKALAEACRVIAPDVLTGVAAYSVEEVELEDMGEQPKAPSAASRLAEAAASPAPSRAEHSLAAHKGDPFIGPEEVTEDVPPAPTEEPKCSRSQQTKLGNALKANGHTTKDEMLRITSAWVGRDVASSAELTVTEANEFTKELEEAAAGQNTDGVIADTADAAWLNGGNGDEAA